MCLCNTCCCYQRYQRCHKHVLLTSISCVAFQHQRSKFSLNGEAKSTSILSRSHVQCFQRNLPSCHSMAHQQTLSSHLIVCDTFTPCRQVFSQKQGLHIQATTATSSCHTELVRRTHRSIVAQWGLCLLQPRLPIDACAWHFTSPRDVPPTSTSNSANLSCDCRV